MGSDKLGLDPLVYVGLGVSVGLVLISSVFLRWTFVLAWF